MAKKMALFERAEVLLTTVPSWANSDEEAPSGCNNLHFLSRCARWCKS